MHNPESFDRYADDAQLLFAAVELSPTPMIVTDARLPDHPIVYTNHSFQEMTGYAASEIIGRNCRFLQGPLTAPDAVARMRDAIAARSQTSVRILNYRKDGSTFWNVVFIAPVYSSAHELRYFIASEINVSLWLDADSAPSVQPTLDSLRQLTQKLAIEFDAVLAALSRYAESTDAAREASAPALVMLERNLASIEASLKHATALTHRLMGEAA